MVETQRRFHWMITLDKRHWFLGPAQGNGDSPKNFKRRPERSNLTLEGRAIKPMVWGPKVESTKLHGFTSRDTFRSESVRDGESAGLLREGTHCNERERLLLSENWTIDLITSETSGDFETWPSQLDTRVLLSTNTSTLVFSERWSRLSNVDVGPEFFWRWWEVLDRLHPNNHVLQLRVDQG